MCRRPQQSGFTAGRSTIDVILLLSELHHGFNQPFNVAYIDIKAAFDSVDRRAFWKAPWSPTCRRSRQLHASMSCHAAPHSWHVMVWLHLECRSCRSNTWREHHHASSDTSTGVVWTCSSSSKYRPCQRSASSVHIYRRMIWRSGRRMWKQQRGRPRNTWARQEELDTDLKADAAWTAAQNAMQAWSALYVPQLVKRSSEWVSEWFKFQLG